MKYLIVGVLMILSFNSGIFYNSIKLKSVRSECYQAIIITDWNKYYKFPDGFIQKFSFESAFILIENATYAEIFKCIDKKR